MRSRWSNRWVFVMATAGSAVGLGNIWKFPCLTSTANGVMQQASASRFRSLVIEVYS
jgi:hypothetical protein